jgi:hypothetical protein
MDIIVGELIDKIKKVFDSTKVLSVETVYEKINGSNDLKLVISMNKILYDDINIIYTKLIFVTDNTKSKLTKNNFTYLYDINCEYVRINFNDLEDFSIKITEIFEKNKFGENIKILSTFIKSPSTLINEWFQENKITDLSIVNVEEPKISIMPCKFLNFDFKVELNNNQNIELEISKDSEKEYIFKFKFLDKVYDIQQANLKNLVYTIGSNIKDIFKNKV